MTEKELLPFRMHENEYRRPCITIASTDKELLVYLHSLTSGTITSKRNYNSVRHKDSYTLTIKNKVAVLSLLNEIVPYLRITKKRKRALFILMNYVKVTPRNGKYSPILEAMKIEFEESFFKI